MHSEPTKTTKPYSLIGELSTEAWGARQVAWLRIEATLGVCWKWGSFHHSVCAGHMPSASASRISEKEWLKQGRHRLPENWLLQPLSSVTTWSWPHWISAGFPLHVARRLPSLGFAGNIREGKGQQVSSSSPPGTPDLPLHHRQNPATEGWGMRLPWWAKTKVRFIRTPVKLALQGLSLSGHF